LVVLLLFCNISPVIEVESQTSEPPANTLQEYLNQCLPYYLLGQGLDPTDGSYSLSQGLEIVNSSDPNKRVYYLFCDNECMGELIVTLNGTEYVSSFMYGPLPAVTAAYRSGSPVSLYIEGNSCYLWTPNGTTQMSGPQTSISSTISTANPSLNLSPTVLSTTSLALETPAQTRSNSSVETFRLDVPVVRNGTNPYNDGGLCWAACVASIGAYMTNTHPLTALEMFEWVDDEINPWGYSYPTGIPRFVEPALELFDIEFSYLSSGLEWDDVELLLTHDIPIYASIQTSTGADSHGVVICGYQFVPGAKLLYLMDPNMPYIVSCYKANDSEDLTYPVTYFDTGTAGPTYTDWYRSYYKTVYYEDFE